MNRLRRKLERRLGDQTDVAVKALGHASESGADALTKKERRLARECAAACDAARTAGFRDLGDVQEACFGVRPS